MRYFQRIALIAFAAAVTIVGCGNNDPMSPFNPEISNNPEDFQFQITAARNLDKVQDYIWRNPSGRASINQACSITGGSAILTLIDSTGTTLYTKNLSDNGTFQSSEGFAGPWIIRVAFSNLDGTVNFRVQRL